MSLIERVTQNKEYLGNGHYVESDELERLKHRINQYLSPQQISILIAENPLAARAELGQICERILREKDWFSWTLESKEHLIDRYLDSVFGYGPLEELLGDPTVTEIMVNGVKSLYYEREGRLYQSANSFYKEDEVYSVIDKILSPLGRRVDESSPMVNARLPQGHRVNAIIPPLSLDGPIMTIRKFKERFFSLAEMSQLGSFDDHVMKFLTWAVKSKKNIAVSGGTGSGKTTLLNALSAAIPINERIITIEDSAELRFTEHPHVIRLESRPANAEGNGEVSIRELVINALRMRPDRIVVGECRNAEALDMLQAMNTGHDGSLTTLHANSPREVISRLITMVLYGSELPVHVIEKQIASAIDLVIQVVRDPKGRRYISEIVHFSSGEDDDSCRICPLFKRDKHEDKGQWIDLPKWLDGLVYQEIATSEEVSSWKTGALLQE